MKIYFCNSFLEGCHYVRCLMPMIAGGWDGDKTSLRGPRVSYEQEAKGTIDADTVVFHRPNDARSLQAAKLLRSIGKKIVFDNDDTYKGIDAMKHREMLKEIDQHIDNFVKFADLVTCSTEYLAEEYRKINPNVVVLPNCVDPDDWPEPLKNEGNKVRIGITGSAALNGDFEDFKPALFELNQREDVQLVLFSLPPKVPATEKLVQPLYAEDYKFWQSLNIEWQPFVMMADYFDTLNELRLDLMVIPRKDDYFNRCKSNLKFLEASMLEIPCISQGFSDGKSPYEVNPEDAKHQIIVSDNAKWLEAVDGLIKDKAKRRAMGLAAKEYVLNNYQIKDNIWKWEKTYASIK